MRKTWTTLVVLGILLCMVVSLGANAHAAEDALTILAVNGDALSDEQLAALKSEYTNGYILDVSGNGTSSALDIVFSETYPVDAAMAVSMPGEDVTEFLYLGDPMTLEANGSKITLVGVNGELDAGTLSGLLAGAEGKVVAVGKANGGEAVKGAGIGLFLTTDAGDGVQTMVTANVDYTQTVNVGKDSAYPITKITLDWEGNLQAEPMAAPESVAMTEPGPVEEPSFEEPAAPVVYSVTYDPNGADGGSMEATEAQADNLFYLPENGFTCTGYTFAGWNIGGTTYQPGDSLYLSGDTIIYATWNQDYAPAVYTVSYDGSGAENGSMSTSEVTEGNSLQLPENGFTRDGYEFTGWNVNGASYQPYDTVSVSGDMIVYAEWAAAAVTPQFNITYQPGEGAVGEQIVDTWDNGTPIGLPDCPAGWSRDGYTFTGWTKDGEHYDVWAQYYVEGDATFAAEWTANEAAPTAVNATITYDPNGGTCANTEDLTQVVADIGEGMDWMFPENTFITAPEGQTFAGWQVGDDASVTYKPYEEMHLTGDVIIRALWEQAAETAATDQDAGIKNGTDTRTWKIGGTDALVIGFTNAKVQTVAAGVEGVTAETLAEGTQYTLTDNADDNGNTVTFIQGFLNSLTPDNTYNVTFSFAPAADGTTYAPISVGLHVSPADAQDAGIQNGTDMRTWKIGGTDTLSISFANARVSDVLACVDGEMAQSLTEGSNYSVTTYNTNGSTVTFVNSYLNGLKGDTLYDLYFHFADGADGTTYAPVSLQMHVSAADAAATTPSVKSWNRANELPLTFEGRVPSGMQIKFGADNYVNGTAGTDFRVNGSTITLLPAMINGASRWQAWSNGGYTFRILFTSGDPVDLSINVEGTIPTTQATTPTATPAPGTTAAPNLGPTAPVTGDTTPIGLYVAILVLLVAALAIVIILLTKKNRGRR